MQQNPSILLKGALSIYLSIYLSIHPFFVFFTWSTSLSILLEFNPCWTSTAVEGWHGREKTQVGTASVSFTAWSLNCGAKRGKEESYKTVVY